jgi:hypothetical protein
VLFYFWIRKGVKVLAEKMGRPTKLTKEIHNTIIRYIKAGNYVETAAAAAGINKSTLYDWLKRGANEPETIFEDFSNAVAQAMAQSEIDMVNKLKKHEADSAQPIEWRLERRFPERWGRKDKIQADINSTHTEKEEILFEQKLTSCPEARELLRQLFRKQMELESAGEK